MLPLLRWDEERGGSKEEGVILLPPVECGVDRFLVDAVVAVVINASSSIGDSVVNEKEGRLLAVLYYTIRVPGTVSRRSGTFRTSVRKTRRHFQCDPQRKFKVAYRARHGQDGENNNKMARDSLTMDCPSFGHVRCC
jgi:hypothetical protein